MTLRPLPAAAALLLAFGLLAGCSPGQPSQPAVPAAPVDTPQDADNLAMYRTLVARGQFELAAPIGEGLLKRSPDSPAATEVRKDFDAVKAKADAINDKRRLQGLWLYQSGEQSGGQQNTATIHPSQPSWAHARVRLILRRHSDWGPSVYLYDTGDAGFVCKGRCRLALKIDGAEAKPLTGYLPDSGEPAMFIDRDKAFVELLRKAATLDIEVQVKGREAEALHFETAGFDAAQWPEPAVRGKSGKRG